MKQKLLLVVFLLSAFYAEAQLVNVNPDPNGEPWITGGWKNPTKQQQSKIDEIRTLKLPQNYQRSKSLPSSLDNSTNQYFRPIFNQSDGSCSQASGVGYNFTYEINRVRNTNASLSTNQFPTHFTYNFLNNGSGENGSVYFDGWAIIKENGCPTVQNYGGDLASYGAKAWVSGYDTYINSMQNRVDEIVAIDVSDATGLEVLKNWMYDHLNGSATGSIVNFAAGTKSTDGFTMTNGIITKWGRVVNHAMTFVGWDDDIKYDFNEDEQFTNDIDITGDGKVDMRDWEIGAVILVNSWGENWGTGGKAYVMYKLLAETVENGGIQSNKVYSINVKPVISPKLIMKMKMQHSSRDKIKIMAGISTNLESSTPEFEMSFPLFNQQGGSFQMQGINSNPIELALDITPLLSYVDENIEAKYFLKVIENDENSSSSGIISDFSIYDYDIPEEYISDNHNVAIADNSATLLSVHGTIDYDAPSVTTSLLDEATPNLLYSAELEASGGTAPYKWSLLLNYDELENATDFPTAETRLNPTDNDDGYASLTLDFPFPFYGTESNKITINTDGSLVFENEFNYLRSEQAIKTNKMIAVFASDLMIYPAVGDGIFYSGDENSAVIRWKTSLFDNQSANVDVAVKLFPSGEIQYFYGSGITEGINFASGISNGDEINFVIASTSNIANPSNQKVRFFPEDFPLGMSISEDGIFSGVPKVETSSWDINFRVTDYKNISKTRKIAFSTGIASSVNVLENEYDFSCFPNPATDFTVFQFNLNERASVNLEIYDLTGKKIISILNKTLETGEHNIKRNFDLEKGVYIYKLKVGNKAYSDKLLIK